MGTRMCKTCLIEKSLDDFPKHKQSKGGYRIVCKVCSYAKQEEWRAKNNQHCRDRINKRNRERKLRVIEHFGSKCSDCGGSFPPCVYDFHHLDKNEKDVNPSAAMAWAEGRMWKELEKCVMLCSNCHRIRHHDKEL